jgi:hypothetical protein
MSEVIGAFLRAECGHEGTDSARERSGGRKAGTPNKNTKILKDALLDAAAALGFLEEVTLLDDDGRPTDVIKLVKTGVDGMTGYLEWLGINHPHTFAALLGRVLPTQLNIKTTSSLKVTYKTVAEANQALIKGRIEPVSEICTGR